MGRFISFRNYFANPLVCYLIMAVSVTIGMGMDVKNIVIASACFYLYTTHAVLLLIRFWDEIGILLQREKKEKIVYQFGNTAYKQNRKSKGKVHNRLEIKSFKDML